LCTQQDLTALSSGEADICATNEASKSVVGMRHLAESVRSSGFNISDTLTHSPLYNDNAACIQWSHNMTFRHMELRENSVHKWVENTTLNVLHVSGHVNPAYIFTKEMGDGAHFRRLWDSFMCCLSNFLQQSLLIIHHQSQSTSHTTPCQVVPSAVSSKAMLAQYCTALCSFLYVGPSQPFLICRVRVVSLYDAFITLPCHVCSEIRYHLGRMVSGFSTGFFSPTTSV
jgi:hypothetical protein